MKYSMRTLTFGVSLLLAATAQAGPNVNVTFQNQSAVPVNLKLVTSNESTTYQLAEPKPPQQVAPQQSINFNVQRLVSPDVNAAMVRFANGSKTCAFSTTYQLRTLPGGIKQPQWNKSATPSGGANCTATITSTRADYSWDVVFTMK